MASSPVGSPDPPAAAAIPGAPTFLAVAAPYATAFFSSMCIMTVELVAGRLIARHVGSSIYTWTSVIGVVLAGIAIGNWIGGRLADRHKATNALGALFMLASIACLATPGINKLVGNWAYLWKQEWPVRIFAHVFLVFFVPSTILGCIGPLAAKMALDLGRQVGRTVGTVYAWGAVGSIVGTFLTGFLLISRLGTMAVLVSVALALAVVALLFGVRSLFPYLWAGAVFGLVASTMGPWAWAKAFGNRLGIVNQASSSVLMIEESQYSYIQVEEEEDPPSTRAMSLDHLVHAYVVMDNPDDLQYDYEDLYAAITKTASRDRKQISSLFLGGGGFVFPRYILSKYPGSHVEVAEIDPAVTRAAKRAFGLAADSSMKIYDLDARNHIDDLIARKRRGEATPAFDFVYGDAFNHYAVPFHLTTLEFVQKLDELMSPTGAYMQNILDIYEHGRFLGAVVNTVKKVFPYVYCYSTVDGKPSVGNNRRDTFVVVGSKVPLTTTDLGESVSGFSFRPEHFEELRQRSRNIVLTDDFAPVEQLLEPVIRLADKEG